jgi:ElaB/YqjD/DUF883 family membrane-anchored ribosome-binding protein
MLSINAENSMPFPSTDTLADEVRKVIERTEDLISATADNVEGRVADARAGVTSRLRRVKRELANLEDEAIRRGRRTARAVDGYAHDNPWKIAGIAAVAAFAVALLLTSRRDD